MLVYDFGRGAFDTALVRINQAAEEVLGFAALENCGGYDVDSLISAEVRANSSDWLDDTVAGT